MTKPVEPYCCHIGEDGECKDAAEWEIWWGSWPDEYTHSCTKHVGAQLEPDSWNDVGPLSSNQSPTPAP